MLLSTRSNNDLIWIQQLNKSTSAEALRDYLKSQYPLINLTNIKKVIIVGAAGEGQRLLHLCNHVGIEVVNLCDDNPDQQGIKLGQHTVEETTCLKKADKNIPVVIASHRLLSAFQRCRSQGHTLIMPFALLQILDQDKFPPHMFYTHWLESLFNNRDKVNDLADLLADDKSRAVLNALIGFRLTLDPAILVPIIDWDLYGSEDILNFTDNEIYIDAGAFDGDTIRSFIKKVNGKFDKIYAFEPDSNTFKKLKKNFHSALNIKLFNKGLYSHPNTLYFDNAGTRGSIFSKEKNHVIKVPVTSIDATVKETPISFIKMNIEGAELPALKGASASIAQYRPKLAISAYHRPTDLWEIPLLIQKLNDNYKLHLRQHDAGVIETVLYAI